MRYIHKLALIFLAAFATISCEVVDVAEHSNMADISWYLSSNNDNYDPIELSMNKHLSLMDLSQGELSHVWIVPEHSGIKFIDGDMGYSDVDYESMIIPCDYITSKKTIHLYFTKAGEFDVTLLNTFNRPVSYTYIDKDKKRVTVNSTIENGVHTIRKSFPIKVYASKIEPSARVYLDSERTKEVEVGYEEDGTTLKSVTIEYGDTLYFDDDSYDTPNSWIWNCSAAGYSNIEGESTEMTFTTLTNGTPFKVSQTVERKFVSGYTPTAAAVTKTLDLNIYVEESSEPLEVLQPKQRDGFTLEVSLGNGEFDPETIANTASYFSLAYVNGDKSGTISISDVAIDPESPSTLVLTLSEQIYNTDTLTLSYTGVTIGVLYNVNDFAIDIDNQSVKTTYAAIFAYDFEEDTAGEISQDWCVTVAAELTDGQTLTDVTVAQENGNKYITADLTDATCSIYATSAPRFTLNVPFDGVARTYTLKLKYRVSAKKSGFNFDFLKSPYTNSGSNWISGPWQQVGNAEVWNSVEKTISPTSDVEDIMFMIRTNLWEGRLDIDDISLGNTETRP